MLDFFQAVWMVSFETIQQVFNFDYFIGSYIGLLVVVVSTVYLLTYILISFTDYIKRW